MRGRVRQRSGGRFKGRLGLRRVMAGVVMTVVVGLVGLFAVKMWQVVPRREQMEAGKNQMSERLKAKLIDENAGGVEVGGETMTRVNEIAVKIEKGFNEAGKRVEKMVLPREKVREMYVFIGEEKWFFKVSLVRGAGETVEDAMRMLEEVERRKVKVKEYIDVRLERRGYYK